MKNCPSPSPCNRVNNAFPESLPTGFAQELAWRVLQHFDEGDLDTAESFVHLLVRHLEERSRPVGHGEVVMISPEDSAWMAQVTVLLGRVNLARGHIPEAKDTFMRLVQTFSEVAGHIYYQEEYADALFGAMRCLYLEHDRTGFNRLLQLFDTIPAKCTCMRIIQLNLLRGLKALRDQQYMDAALAFKSNEKYRLVSLFSYTVSVMGQAEAALRQGGQGSELLASALTEQVDHLFSRGTKGALFGWRNFFPFLIEYANRQRFDWPVAPVPFSELGNVIQLPPSKAAIEIHSFGVGELKIYSGQEHRFPDNPMLKTLLVYLAMHPKGVTVDDLRAEMWVDASSNDTVHKALSALRQKIGAEHLVQEHHLYKLVNPVWLDVIEFERLYTVIQEAKKACEVMSEMRSALALYTQPFLVDVSNIMWVRQERSRLRNMAGWILCRMAEVEYESNNLYQAEQILQRALDINPIFDSAVALLMRLYEDIDNRTIGAELYEAYAEKVWNRRHVRPSPSLAKIYQRWQDTPDLMVTAPFKKKELQEAIKDHIATIPTGYLPPPSGPKDQEKA